MAVAVVQHELALEHNDGLVFSRMRVPGTTGARRDLRLQDRSFVDSQRDAQTYRPQFERLAHGACGLTFIAARSYGASYPLEVPTRPGQPARGWNRTWRLILLGSVGSLLAGLTSASASQPSPYLYDAANTAACLYAQRDVVDALPPATSPSRPILYIYFPRPERYSYPKGTRRLRAWYGAGAADTLQGASLIFFRSYSAARHFRDDDNYKRGFLARNVLIEWTHEKDSSRSLGRVVRSCLRTQRQGHGEARPPHRSLPKADLKTFTGHWGGHTRRLIITRSGLGTEIVDDGCCTPVFNFAFQLVRASGTVKNATAIVRVTAVRLWKSNHRPHVGQIGRLVLKNGIVTDNLSHVYFCSDPAWGATGACGA